MQDKECKASTILHINNQIKVRVHDHCHKSSFLKDITWQITTKQNDHNNATVLSFSMTHNDIWTSDWQIKNLIAVTREFQFLTSSTSNKYINGVLAFPLLSMTSPQEEAKFVCTLNMEKHFKIIGNTFRLAKSANLAVNIQVQHHHLTYWWKGQREHNVLSHRTITTISSTVNTWTNSPLTLHGLNC